MQLRRCSGLKRRCVRGVGVEGEGGGGGGEGGSIRLFLWGSWGGYKGQGLFQWVKRWKERNRGLTEVVLEC